MLGITVPDAIAVGTFALAVAAFIFGRKSGDTLAKVKPPEPVTSGIAAGFVDKDLMQRLVDAVEIMAAGMNKHIQAELDERDRAFKDALKRLQDSQDELLRAATQKRHEDDDRADRSSVRAERPRPRRD